MARKPQMVACIDNAGSRHGDKHSDDWQNAVEYEGEMGNSYRIFLAAAPFTDGKIISIDRTVHLSHESSPNLIRDFFGNKRCSSTSQRVCPWHWCSWLAKALRSFSGVFGDLPSVLSCTRTSQRKYPTGHQF